MTWSINSICHYFGNRRFEIEDRSTNVFWLAIPSIGESWHPTTTTPSRARQPTASSRREIDVSAGVIRMLEKVGLAWNVVRIAPERQASKLVGATPATPAPARAAEQAREPAGVA